LPCCSVVARLDADASSYRITGARNTAGLPDGREQMNSESERRSRAARWRLRLIGIGFLLAFAASVATLIFTGLRVRGAVPEHSAAAHGAADDRRPASR
jgi:hypothetical protein